MLSRYKIKYLMSTFSQKNTLFFQYLVAIFVNNKAIINITID